MKRQIKTKTKGRNHGMITNMINPGDLGQMTKPFVFLDYVHGVPPQGAGFGWHPHSGIATFTYYIEGGSDLEESTGNKVSFRAGDVEYLQAGAGAWHKGSLLKDQPTLGFQLWISLPPELEKEEAKSIFLTKNEIESNDKFKVLLGEYDGLKSAVTPPNDMTYLDVSLKPGDTWTYTPPEGHDVLWYMVYKGKLSDNMVTSVGELVVFEEGNETVEFNTEHGVSFLIGSAKKFDYDLVLGRSSVHTSEENLEFSKQKINKIYSELVKKGVFQS